MFLFSLLFPSFIYCTTIVITIVIKMELSEALDRAEKNENVQRLKDFFLGSGFASINTDKQKDEGIKEWTLLYYNPAKKSVVDCFVNEKFVTVGEETPAINEVQELDVSKVKTTLQAALKTTSNSLKKKPLNILISLHMKDINNKHCAVWTIGFVTADMSVTSYDIDASNGKIAREETTRLLRRL